MLIASTFMCLHTQVCCHYPNNYVLQGTRLQFLMYGEHAMCLTMHILLAIFKVYRKDVQSYFAIILYSNYLICTFRYLVRTDLMW